MHLNYYYNFSCTVFPLKESRSFNRYGNYELLSLMGGDNFPKDFSILLLYHTISKAEMPRIGPQHKMR